MKMKYIQYSSKEVNCKATITTPSKMLKVETVEKLVKSMVERLTNVTECHRASVSTYVNNKNLFRYTKYCVNQWNYFLKFKLSLKPDIPKTRYNKHF